MTRPEMESRRLSAALDLKAGIKVTEVAKKWGVSRISADRWKRELRECGGLESRKSTGRPPRLTGKQCQNLQHCHFSAVMKGERWTNKVLRVFVWRKYRVKFSEDHASRILLDLRTVTMWSLCLFFGGSFCRKPLVLTPITLKPIAWTEQVKKRQG